MYDNKKINLSNSMDTTIGNFSSIYNYEHLDFFLFGFMLTGHTTNVTDGLHQLITVVMKPADAA
jgi:hypothetical protein